MSKRVLIADDTKINLNVLKTILLKYNYLVDTATNGQELIEQFESGKYAIMFIDIQMPDLNGDDAFLRLKEQYNNLPYTIAVSAVEFPDEIENYDEIGFDDFMSKPINEVKIKLVLENYLQKVN